MFLWSFKFARKDRDFSAGERYSLIADIALDGLDACIKADSILLERHFLLDESVNLLLEEVAFVDLVDLKLLEVFIKVLYIFNDLL